MTLDGTVMPHIGTFPTTQSGFLDFHQLPGPQRQMGLRSLVAEQKGWGVWRLRFPSSPTKVEGGLRQGSGLCVLCREVYNRKNSGRTTDLSGVK